VRIFRCGKNGALGSLLPPSARRPSSLQASLSADVGKGIKGLTNKTLLHLSRALLGANPILFPELRDGRSGDYPFG